MPFDREHRPISLVSSSAGAPSAAPSVRASGNARLAGQSSASGPALFPRERLAAVFFLSAVFLIYASVWRGAPFVEPDTPTYQQLAEDIKHGSSTQLSLRTPGLPLVLLLTGSETTPTRSFYLLSLAMHLSSIGMLALLLRYFRISVWATALFMVLAELPPFVEPAAYALSETLSEFLVVLTVASLAAWLITQRSSLMVAFGLAATGAAFTRPTFQALTAILWVCVFACYWLGYLRQISLRTLLVWAAATMLLSFGAQGAYALFNYEKFGYLGMSSYPPYGLSTKVEGVLESIPPRDADVRDILVRHRDRLLVDPNYDHTGQDYIYRAMPDLVGYYGGDRMRALRKIQELSLYLIKARPMSYLNECVKAAAVYWMPTDGPLSGAGSNARRGIWALTEFAIIGLFFLQTMVLAGHAVFHLPAYWAGHGVAHLADGFGNGLLISVYVAGSAVIWSTMAVSCLLAIGLPRYRIPTDLLIMAVTVLGFEIWKNNLRGVTRPNR